MADSGLQDAGNGWVTFGGSPGASRLSESVELQLTESIINGAENAVPNTPQHNAGELSADPSTEPAGAKKVKPRFEGLKTEMDRETEKSLNVMVVGESGLGKSTLVDTFLRPYRMKEMDRIGEKTWKVKEKEEELLVCENKVTEAKKELERLREKKEYSQCETKSEDIKGLEASMTELQEQISTLKLIDGENRAKLEALRKNIAKLTRDEDEMSRNRNFTEAQKIKEQLEEKEKEKRELTKQLQTQVKREDTPDATPDAVPVLGRKTVQIEEKEKFTIHHKVGDEPPVKLKVTLIDTPGYGEDSNLAMSFDTICKYVEQRFMEHKRASDAANRSMAALDGCDQLVHCCLYFIAPHRIKPVDLMFMKKLHKMVPIIPIIAKSDTMTTDEKMNFKEEVRKELQKHEIVTFEFRQMVLEKMTGQVGTKVEPPWAVIGTKDGVVRDGELQDAFRKYDWGDADAADPRHSDLLALQTLLLGDVQQWIELKTTTNDKYEAWRTELLQKSRLRRLREAVVTTYQRLPPMLVLSFVVLLLSLLLVPTAHAALGDSSDSRVCCSRRDELEWQLREKAAELARARSHGFH